LRKSLQNLPMRHKIDFQT